jgi:hypothetical protein
MAWALRRPRSPSSQLPAGFRRALLAAVRDNIGYQLGALVQVDYAGLESRDLGKRVLCRHCRRAGRNRNPLSCQTTLKSTRHDACFRRRECVKVNWAAGLGGIENAATFKN